MRLLLLPQLKVVALGVLWLSVLDVEILGISYIGLIQRLFDVFVPSLHHNISIGFLLQERRHVAALPTGAIGRRRGLHRLQRLRLVSEGTRVLAGLRLLLALVVRVSWTLDIHEEINFYVIELVLLNWKNDIILLEDNLIFMTLLATLVHVIEDLALLTDQKSSFDLGFSLLLEVLALASLARVEEVVELLGGHELLERYLFDWAVHGSSCSSWTEPRRGILNCFDRDGLRWDRRLSAHGVLPVRHILIVLVAHHRSQVQLQVGEVLLPDLEHPGGLLLRFHKVILLSVGKAEGRFAFLANILVLLSLAALLFLDGLVSVAEMMILESWLPQARRRDFHRNIFLDWELVVLGGRFFVRFNHHICLGPIFT